MSIRLQVLLDEAELAEIRTVAAQQHMTVADWVRQALRAARRDEPRIAHQRKLDAVRVAASYDFPTADIDQMLAQIEQGQLGQLGHSAEMIYIDSNVPMYLIGEEHPNKQAARRLIENAVTMRERLVTSAEVFQEILHRYVAIDRPDALAPAFELLLGIADEVYPIDVDDVQHARVIHVRTPRLAARDALHQAVMERYGINEIMSFDRGFDRAPGVRRLGG